MTNESALKIQVCRGAANCGSIQSYWQTVGPNEAAKYLEKNTRNRREMPNATARYAGDMDAGLWQVTHEGIAFDINGALIDGQHRLAAIIQSGKAMDLLVTTGLPVTTMEVINRGKMRSLAHTLQILGYEFASHRTVAVARSMAIGPSRNVARFTMTDSTMRRFIDANITGIMFANVGDAAVIRVVAVGGSHRQGVLSRGRLAIAAIC